MEKDFFIADLHFGSETIIRYEDRPFSSVKEMEEKLIENWNQVVSKEDTVYVLGDFSDQQSREEDERILSRLNGTKILIMGNHDRHRTPEEWREIGFQECSLWPILYREFFFLSHEPLYLNTHMPYASFYGHVHANPSYKDASVQSVCVCVERIGYTPVEFQWLKERLEIEGSFAKSSSENVP